MRRFAFLLTALAFCMACFGAETEKAKVPSLPDSKLTDPRAPTLDLYLRKPAGAGPFAAVVFMHGCAGIEWQFADAAAERYLAMGYAIAILDSLGPRGVLNVCDPRLPFDKQVTPAQRAWDAYAGLAYLSRRPDIDPGRIFLLGESHGGNTVIAALEDDLVRENPLHFAGGIAFYPYCGNLLHPARPLLILAGARDDWTPGLYCRQIAEHLSGPHAPVEVVVYPGAYHAFNHQMRDVIYLGHVLAYDAEAAADSLKRIAEFLRAPGNPPPAR